MNARYFTYLSARDTATDVVLTPLEWMALLFVPLTPVPEPFDYSKAVAALAMADALIAGVAADKHYETYRTAFLEALATLARLPGGVQFGRVHFGIEN